MDFYERIKKVLEPLGIPVHSDWNLSDDQVYFNMSYQQNTRTYADNKPFSETTFLTLHLFVPTQTNTTLIEEETKRLLTADGWTRPSLRYISETDPECRHIIFSCKREDVIIHDA